jgi:glycosyltransferase involved in cell wall biosynthesis
VIANYYTIVSPIRDDAYLSGGHGAAKDLIEALKASGYYVNIVTPSDQFVEPDNADLNVYFDIFNDPQGSEWFGILEQKKFLESNKPYIFAECAYTGATPYEYGGWNVSEQERYSLDNPIIGISSMLIEKAAFNLFLSPLHLNEWAKFTKFEIPNAFIYFQRINDEIFNNQNIERPINVLYVGAINESKGVVEMQLIFGDNIKFIGRGDTSLINPENYLGVCTPEQIAFAMNSSKYFVHMPNWKEASARTVVEAAMCGCKLIVNENVGACSFGITDLSNPYYGQKSFNDLINAIKSIKGS